MGPNASQDYPHYGANFWEDWGETCFLRSVLETDGTYFSAPGGVKIFGGWSRGTGPKVLVSFCKRSQYGSYRIQLSDFSLIYELEDFSVLSTYGTLEMIGTLRC